MNSSSGSNNKRKNTTSTSIKSSQDFNDEIRVIREWEERAATQQLVLSFQLRCRIGVLAKKGTITKQLADICCRGIRKVYEEEVLRIKTESFCRRTRVLRRQKRLERL